MLFTLSSLRNVTMYDALYVPNSKCNLFSVKAVAANDNVMKFGEMISRKNGTQLMGTVADKITHCI